MSGDTPAEDQPTEIEQTPGPTVVQEKKALSDIITSLIGENLDAFHSGDETSPLVQAAVESMAGEEKTRRTNLLVQGVRRHEELKKALAKFRPDVNSFTETGAVATTAFSKAQLDSRNKAKEAVLRMGRAVTEAATSKNFQKLEEELKKPVPSPKDKPDAGS